MKTDKTENVMVFVAGFLKEVAKGAARMMAVQAVVETVMPRAKKIAKKFMDKLHEQHNKQELTKVVEETKARGVEASDADDENLEGETSGNG